MDYIIDFVGTKYLLPILLLAISFLFKLFIHQEANSVGLVYLGLEFPVDIAFLANSFLVAYIIDSRLDEALNYFLMFIVVTIFIVYFWKQSRGWYDSRKYVRCGLMSSFAYFLCIFGLIVSISLLTSIT